MTTTVGTTHRQHSVAELIKGPIAVGLPLGSVFGAVIGGLTRGNLTGGAAVGTVFASAVVTFVVVSGIYTGALGVPYRRPFRPGDRFGGWTVVGRLRTMPDNLIEYEVQRQEHRGRLTLSRADPGQRPLTDALHDVESRHLVHPLDIGRVGEFDFVVVEPKDLEALTDQVSRSGVLAGEELFAVAAGTAVALHAIHFRGHSHGQVRPDRVATGGARVALYSFGSMAQRSDAGYYHAPEQALGVDISTAKSDVFSWASTIFYAAAGRAPFTVPFDGELEPRSDEPTLALCPEWIRPVLDAAFTEDPAARPDSGAILDRLRVIGRERYWRIVQPRPGTALWTRPMRRVTARGVATAVLTVLFAGLLPAVVPPAGSPAQRPVTNPPESLTPLATPSIPKATTVPETTTGQSSATVTTTTTSLVLATIETTVVAPSGHWPTSANDGSPAFYAYLGASFIFPDWVACAYGYCIVGSGDQVHLFTEHPIKQIGQTGLSTQNPQQALMKLGLASSQAASLLARQ